MRRATELAQHCDLFLAIGSSLVVWPAAGFPLMAKSCGAKLVIINNEPTEQDDIADLVIRLRHRRNAWTVCRKLTVCN